MEAQEIEAQIREFIESKFQPNQQLTSQTHLFREAIVDSIGVLELVQFLETRFAVNISPEDMLLANFESIAAMRDFAVRRRQPAP